MYNGKKKSVYCAWSNTQDFKGSLEHLPDVCSCTSHSLICSFRHTKNTWYADTIALSHAFKVIHLYHEKYFSYILWDLPFLSINYITRIYSLSHSSTKYFLSSHCMAVCSRGWWVVILPCWTPGNSALSPNLWAWGVTTSCQSPCYTIALDPLNHPSLCKIPSD